MEKIDRLGWTSGVILRIFGQRFGVRFNSLSSFQVFLKIRESEGWEIDDSNEPVNFLYSVRIAGRPEARGQRHFHLLYSLAARIYRTLDETELWNRLTGAIWAAAALLSKNQLVVRAQRVSLANSRLLVVGSKDQNVGLVDAIREAGGTTSASDFFHLECNNSPAPDIDLLLVPASTVGKDRLAPMSPGEATLELLKESITPVQEALACIGNLSQNRQAVKLWWADGRHSTELLTALLVDSLQNKT